MTKLEFMKQLKSLLSDIPLEEREEALQYYNGYFDDAGEDHVEEIMKELGSPIKVAAIIKADLNSNATDRESRGYFTENGYQDTSYSEEKFEIVGAGNKETGNNEDTKNTGSTSNSYNANNDYNTNNAYNANNGYNTNNANSNWNQGENNNQGTGKATNSNNNQNKNSNILLIILICIFAIPVGLPLIISAFGILISIIATIFGLVLGFGIAGITMIGAGIALLAAGLVQISVPFVGLLLCGSGCIVLGLGMLFTVASGALVKTVLPAILKGFVNVCRLPFRNRSVIA